RHRGQAAEAAVEGGAPELGAVAQADGVELVVVGADVHVGGVEGGGGGDGCAQRHRPLDRAGGGVVGVDAAVVGSHVDHAGDPRGGRAHRATGGAGPPLHEARCRGRLDGVVGHEAGAV